MSEWTPDQLRVLREQYPDWPAASVGEAIGRTEKAVHQKARRLGLAKSNCSTPPWRRGVSSAAPAKLLSSSPAKPHGTRASPARLERKKACRATQFKPGIVPQNYLPVGSLRTGKDGLLEIKVTDDHPTPARRWHSLHRYMWERANGPTPEGHIIVFKPGSRTADPEQVTLDRLECISRAENARRNHPINVSPEFAKLTQLKGAINRQLNRMTKNGSPE